MNTESTKKVIYWDNIEEKGIEEYDEAFLANLRTELKNTENSDIKTIIIPRRFSNTGSFWGCSDKEIMSEQAETELFETFTTCMIHVARRIKDCKNVIGFAYPDFKNDWSILQHYANEHKEAFKAAFQNKHSHYVFIE